MAEPITRTPMIDDDGSGTTGTIINNAWKVELYDQIDAALATAGGDQVPPHAATHKSGGADALALDTLAPPTDITALNATAAAHGLLPKLSGNATDRLAGNGLWVPAGAGGLTETIGTWAPVDASPAGLALSVYSPAYVRHGSLVMLSAWIVYPATSNGDPFEVGGLPIPASSASTGVHGGIISYTDYGQPVTLLVYSANTFRAYNLAGTGLTNAGFSGKSIRFTIWYRAA